MIDYDLIRTAPAVLNVAGVGDLLSIVTATADWERAISAGKSEYPPSLQDIAGARKVLDVRIISSDEHEFIVLFVNLSPACAQHVMTLTDDIRACTDVGLQAIVDGYMAVNTFCIPAGQ